MARSRSRTPSSTPPPAADIAADVGGEFTGKYLVLLRDDGAKEGLQAIKDATGLTPTDFRRQATGETSPISG